MPDEGIKTNPTGTQTPGAEGAGSEFDYGDLNFQDAGVNFTGTTQPKWKWSFDGSKLMIWPVDPLHGQPHHIELTGYDFWKLAQGRVYVDPDGHIEILVWEDRGSHKMQDDAVDAVDQWLMNQTGKIADSVEYQTEGGYYQTIDPEVGPDMDKLMTTYFGYPVSTKKPKAPVV